MSFDFENHHLLAKALQDLAIEGLSQHINLPMVVRCGDSDAAKHTVIQAMTGVSLPQEYFNHRFSMEFHLSQAEPTPLTPKKTSIKISIVPASHRNEEEKARMMALRDDLEYTHDYWHALMTFLIGRSIVELADFSNVTVEDVLRIQIQGPQLASLIISVVPRWPPHTKDYVINRDWLLKHIRSSHSVTAILDIEAIIEEVNTALLNSRLARRVVDGSPEAGGMMREKTALEEKCALLERALQDPQRFDPRRTVLSSSITSSTADTVYTPTESEIHG
ncbi:dynamin family protein [Colletotrichum kahawae]|uniref:Dynamin family protein n=1 Tax=Colletotrichum kahawae TaxID=34407 RepID=A0AAE0D5T5_COLKA|nr:dynamin family protein [Colletotrichum kahawae]